MRTEDGCIIYDCLYGKPEAFGMLVSKYKDGVYAFVYGRLGNFQDAQDVTQEVFEQAYRSLSSLRRWESFTFWLYRIARNLCMDWNRTQSKRPDREFIDDQTPAVLEIPSLDSYHESKVNESLREAVDALPEIYREVLLLHYFGGMTIKDIARAIGASPTAIGTRLSRARAHLKEEMSAMMNTAFDEQKLSAGFTFRVVEAIKRIKIHPVSNTKSIPIGLSIAAGIIFTILSINPHFTIPEYAGTPINSPLPSEAKILKTGEIPVDVVKIFKTPIISSRQDKGKGGEKLPDPHNSVFLASKGDGNTWTKKADILTARFALSISAVNGKIYAIGGQAPVNVIVSTVEEYDPVTDKWAKRVDMPTPRGYLSTSVVNGKIYAIGGWANNKELSIVEEYDPVADKWTKKADIPTPRMNFSITEVNGKIYAIGGWRTGAGRELSTVEEYDPVNDKWTKKADIPTNRQMHSAEAVDGKIYIIGGWRQGATISIVEEYDPVKDEWAKKADMPTARDRFSATAVNDKIYAIGGGLYGKGVNFSIVEEYDPVADKWTRKTDMPTARHFLSTSAVNGKIYAIGGSGNNGTTSSTEEYDAGFSGEGVDFKGKLPNTWGDVRTALNK